MKTNIQKQDTECPYTRGLKAIDWTKVAFPPFSSEECQEKWGMILQKVGHSVTLLCVVKKNFINSDVSLRILIMCSYTIFWIHRYEEDFFAFVFLA